ncbi:MAG: flavin reductase [Anaerolineae bacterium]|nr:flavin reductase [Anaerolineae bacterium]
MTFLDASDTRNYRHVIGQFATGVTIVVIARDGEVRGMTANTLTSLSLDPLLLLIAVGKTAHWADYLDVGMPFSVNILRTDQEDLSHYFAGGARRGMAPPAFHFVPWQDTLRLESCLAALACEVQELLEGGDHWIVVCRVQALYTGNPPRDPLIFYGGEYRQLSPPADELNAP